MWGLTCSWDAYAHYKGADLWGLVPSDYSTAGGDKKGALGRFPTSVSPAAPLFCPVDDKGHPPVPPRISPTPAVGGRRAGVMSLRCQHKVRLKSKALAPFSLGAMGCACPSEVLGFAAYRSLHHPLSLKFTPHSLTRKDFSSLSSTSMIFFSLSLYPIILILAPVLLHLTRC